MLLLLVRVAVAVALLQDLLLLLLDCYAKRRIQGKGKQHIQRIFMKHRVCFPHEVACFEALFMVVGVPPAVAAAERDFTLTQSITHCLPWFEAGSRLWFKARLKLSCHYDKHEVKSWSVIFCQTPLRLHVCTVQV